MAGRSRRATKSVYARGVAPVASVMSESPTEDSGEQDAPVRAAGGAQNPSEIIQAVQGGAQRAVSARSGSPTPRAELSARAPSLATRSPVRRRVAGMKRAAASAPCGGRARSGWPPADGAAPSGTPVPGADGGASPGPEDAESPSPQEGPATPAVEDIAEEAPRGASGDENRRPINPGEYRCTAVLHCARVTTERVHRRANNDGWRRADTLGCSS